MPTLLLLMVLLLPMQASYAVTPDSGLPVGAGEYQYQDPATHESVKVYYYKPHAYTRNTPVVFVLHGLRRNAREYRDSWVKFAERHGLMILAPRFSRDPYPGANGFNLGNVFEATTRLELIGRALPERINPQSQWAFTLIERLFTDFKANRDTNDNPTYYLYGHGAGAQFAHRFALFMPETRAEEIIVGASGWYTMPDKSIEWPYGTGGVPVVDQDTIKWFLARPLLLLAGGADTATISTVMRKTPQAQAQGKNRVARTRHYFEFARQLAQELNTPFNWQLWVIPGVTHSPDQMTPFAAHYIEARSQ